MIQTVSFGDLVDFSDDLEPDYKIGTWDDAIAFGDSIDSHQYLDSFSDRVQFLDRISTGAVFNVSLSDTLDLVEEIVKGRYYADLSDQMLFIDALDAPDLDELYDTLSLDDTISSWTGTPIVESVTFVDSLNYTVIVNYLFSDSLTFTDGISAYINDPWRPIYPILEETP